MSLRHGFTASVAVLLSACAVSSDGAEQRAAVIVSPDAASRESLRQAVASLLGKPVTLADDALTQDSSLTIDRSAARDPSGRKIEVRETAMPDTFQLVRRGSACVLIHDGTKREAELSGVKCEATAR
jgi:hypothetical protein